MREHAVLGAIVGGSRELPGRAHRFSKPRTSLRRRGRAGLVAWIVLAHALLPAALACAEDSRPAATAPRFDAQRAFLDLRDLVAIGPRPAGSAGAARTRELIRTRMTQVGWVVASHAFSAGPPGADPIAMENLIATRRGRSDATLVLAAHYDTKPIPGIEFVGANDGASGVALLLELARALGPEPSEHTIQMFFFDGEEAVGPSIVASDGLFGSRALAQKMVGDGTLSQVRDLILFDMVADRDLNLATDLNSAPRLREVWRRHAGALLDPAHRMSVVDDHIPFRDAGLDSVLLVIDFQYGARVTPGPTWHTASDTLAAVSAESLGAVGQAAVELVIDLDSAGAR